MCQVCGEQVANKWRTIKKMWRTIKKLYFKDATFLNPFEYPNIFFTTKGG